MPNMRSKHITPNPARAAPAPSVLGNVSETQTPTTCLKSMAVHLQFVRQYAPHLYRHSFLASKLRRKGNPAIRLPFVLQYAPHLYGSTPPHLHGSTFGKILGVGVTGTFLMFNCQSRLRVLARPYPVSHCQQQLPMDEHMLSSWVGVFRGMGFSKECLQWGVCFCVNPHDACRTDHTKDGKCKSSAQECSVTPSQEPHFCADMCPKWRLAWQTHRNRPLKRSLTLCPRLQPSTTPSVIYTALEASMQEESRDKGCNVINNDLDGETLV